MGKKIGLQCSTTAALTGSDDTGSITAHPAVFYYLLNIIFYLKDDGFVYF